MVDMNGDNTMTNTDASAEALERLRKLVAMHGTGADDVAFYALLVERDRLKAERDEARKERAHQQGRADRNAAEHAAAQARAERAEAERDAANITCDTAIKDLTRVTNLHIAAPTFEHKVKVLLSYGFTIGLRDTRFNTDYDGHYMVVEGVVKEIEEEFDVPFADGSNGPWCVVGDNLADLVDNAFDYASLFDSFGVVLADVMAGGGGEVAGGVGQDYRPHKETGHE